jgi:regulator of protease activity HflC (stomatin/prohibitin superfamily)
MLKFLARYIVPLSIGIAIIVIVIGVKFMIIRIDIDKVGVKTSVWGVKRGVVQRDYEPGWHRYIRRIENWDVYDSTVQTMNFTREARTPEGKIESRELPIRTVDDYNVTVDIIIKFQIQRGKAHKIREEIGPGDRYKGFIASDIREVSRNVLGKMTEKDLYNPDQKRKRAAEAKQLLAVAFENRHINIIDFLILDMRFDPQLERKIKNVKLAELDQVLNISKERAVNQRGITQTIDATTEALAEKIQSNKDGKIVSLNAEMVTKVTEILADANKFLIEKKAEGNLYKEERRAAGELLIARAKAEGERLRRKAMTGAGGDLIVALEAARNINLNDVVVSTQDVDLLDIEKMIDKLGGTIEIRESSETREQKILRGKKEREDFFRLPRRMPEGLKVPEELEKELKEEKPVVPEELQGKIDKEWESLTEEFPVSQ